MTSKVVATPEEAVADVPDGAMIAISGFGAGYSYWLVKALADREPKPGGLTYISTSARGGLALLEADCVRKVITPYPAFGVSVTEENPLVERWKRGEIEVETAPLGNIILRLWMAGAGIAGLYTPTGVGTYVEETKESRFFDDKKYLLETPLKPDYAFVRAHKADPMGNLVYRRTGRNHGVVMAKSARITIAEVDEIVEPGDLGPEIIHTPSIYVKRVVKCPPPPSEWRTRGLRRWSK